MRQWLAAALTLAVAACAAPSARPTLGAAPDMAAPLDARVFPPYYGSVPIQLSKPAYVALFEVIPGRGAALLYPQAGSGFHQVTESWVPMRYSASRWLYRTDAPGRFGYQSAAFSSGYDQYRGYDPYGFARPRYLFLVASEEPLAVEQFQGDPAGIVRYLGVSQYASFEPYDVMERLAYAMLPFAPSDSWVMDVFVDWGYDWTGFGPGMTAAQATYWPVVCGDGSVRYMRYVSGWGFSTPPCLGASVVAPGTPLPPNVPIDTADVPVPPGEGHDRTASPDDRGRRRAGASATMDATLDPAAARERQRIAALRADAERDGFRRDLANRIGRDVQQRQRAARARGFDQPAHLGTATSTARDPMRGVGGGAATRARATGGSTGTAVEEARRSREASAAAERSRVRMERATAEPSSSSTGSSTGSAGGSSGGSSGSTGSSSGGRSRTTPPPA